jgi:hypothetical protein
MSFPVSFLFFGGLLFSLSYKLHLDLIKHLSAYMSLSVPFLFYAHFLHDLFARLLPGQCFLPRLSSGLCHLFFLLLLPVVLRKLPAQRPEPLPAGLSLSVQLLFVAHELHCLPSRLLPVRRCVHRLRLPLHSLQLKHSVHCLRHQLCPDCCEQLRARLSSTVQHLHIANHLHWLPAGLLPRRQCLCGLHGALHRLQLCYSLHGVRDRVRPQRQQQL